MVSMRNSLGRVTFPCNVRQGVFQCLIKIRERRGLFIVVVGGGPGTAARWSQSRISSRWRIAAAAAIRRRSLGLVASSVRVGHTTVKPEIVVGTGTRRGKSGWKVSLITGVHARSTSVTLVRLFPIMQILATNLLVLHLQAFVANLEADRKD